MNVSWKELSLREKIGQVVMLQTIPEDHIKKCGSIENFMKTYPIGGLYATGALDNGVMLEIKDSKQVFQQYKKYSKTPLLIANDMEFGSNLEGLVLFPRQIALGATHDLDLAYDFGRALAMEAKECGINWLFSPVVDMPIYPLVLTDTRSVSDDPKQTVAIAKRIMDGMQAEGVMPAIKHFPAGGLEKVDSHLVRYQPDCTKEFWDENCGYIYQELIDYGTPAVMSAHFSLPCYQSEQERSDDGAYEICTLSKELTTDLLKTKMGFEGVVVTDALVMGGFAGKSALENMVKSFAAGTDMLLWPKVEVIDEIEKRILNGEIPMARLDDAVSRIWTLKEKLGLFATEKAQEEPVSKEFLLDVSKRIAEGCITLVRNESGRIPFEREKIHNVLVVSVTPNDEDHEAMCTILDAFERRGIKAEVWRDVWMDRLDEQKQSEYDLIIFAISRLPHRPAGSMDVYGNQAYSVWTFHSCDTTKTVAASFGTPYIYRYFNWDDMYINAYSPSPDVMEAFVAAILGEIPFKGKSPVDLNRALV